MIDPTNARSTPRHLRTPVSEAGEIVIHLGEIWDQITTNALPNSKHDFLNEIFGPMFQNEETSGDDQYAASPPKIVCVLPAPVWP